MKVYKVAISLFERMMYVVFTNKNLMWNIIRYKSAKQQKTEGLQKQPTYKSGIKIPNDVAVGSLTQALPEETKFIAWIQTRGAHESS